MLIVNSNMIVFPCIATMPRFFVVVFFNNHLVLESFEMNKKIISWELKGFFFNFQVNFSGLFEVLAVLLDWTSEVHLQKMPTFQDSPQGRLQEQQLDIPSSLVHEKCLKVSQLDWCSMKTELNWVDPMRRRREVDRFLRGRTKKWTQRVCSTLYSIVLVPW